MRAPQKRRRLAKIRNLVAELPTGEVAVHEDEADAHLDPKVGLDWMPRGVQKELLTPGSPCRRWKTEAPVIRRR